MQLKILFFFSIIIFSSSVLNAQLYETIEKNSADLLILLSNKDSSYKKDLENLKSLLLQDVNSDELEKTYLTSLSEYDSLKNHLSEFETELKNISLDSALVLFNQWYLHLSNVFYNYAENKFFSSDKTKIILFSTSMSCYCTLEMCKNQTTDILRFVNENNGEYDYWIIDSYEHNDLQIKYETYFAPSVLVLDKNNEMLHKIEYEAELNDKLVEFFNMNHKAGE